MGPRHLTADTVSCKQLPTVTTRTKLLSKVESSYFSGQGYLLESYVRKAKETTIRFAAGQGDAPFSLNSPIADGPKKRLSWYCAARPPRFRY